MWTFVVNGFSRASIICKTSQNLYTRELRHRVNLRQGSLSRWSDVFQIRGRPVVDDKEIRSRIDDASRFISPHSRGRYWEVTYGRMEKPKNRTIERFESVSRSVRRRCNEPDSVRIGATSIITSPYIDPICDNSNPEAIAMKNELRAHVRAALRKVSADSRKLLILRCRGIRVSRIARLLGCSKSTYYKKLLPRARAEFSRHFHPDDF